MDIAQIWQSIILGIVEGLTEFIPVSSTGHLILLRDIIGFQGPPGQVFEIAIQLGAILAVCWKYRQKLLEVVKDILCCHSEQSEESNNLNRSFTAFRMTSSHKFVLNIIIAFLPAAIIGVMFHSYIKEALFNPTVVASMLIIGGVLIILVESLVKKVKFKTIDEIKPMTALKIGLFQTLAMIPGTSRSGATIMGSLLLGLDRRAATEFSFFLAIPTMLGATVYDLYKNWNLLEADSFVIIGIGFVTAFFAALLVVNWVINFISTHGFKPFAYYRIVVGVVMIIGLNVI